MQRLLIKKRRMDEQYNLPTHQRYDEQEYLVVQSKLDNELDVLQDRFPREEVQSSRFAKFNLN